MRIGRFFYKIRGDRLATSFFRRVNIDPMKIFVFFAGDINVGSKSSLQIVQYLADSFVSVLAHDAEIVKDWAVLLDGLAYAVFKDFKGETKVESMLYEGLAGGVIDEVRVKVQFIGKGMEVARDVAR